MPSRPTFRAWAVLLLLAAAASPLVAQRSESQTNRHDLTRRQFDARIVRVADADTLDAMVVGESRPIRIRLEGIDGPERGEVFDREATARLRTLVFDRVVRVHGKSVDRYGRLIARVSSNGRDASRELVSAGLACHAYAFDPALEKDEAAARAAGAGFWSSRTKPACVTRTAFSARTGDNIGLRSTPSTGRPATSTKATAFRGNVATGLYHAASCPNYTCRNCTREFATEADARAAGFRPAGDCLRK